MQKFGKSSLSRLRVLASLGSPKFKVGHVTLTTPLLRVICHQYAGVSMSTYVQNLTTIASAIPEIRLVPTKI